MDEKFNKQIFEMIENKNFSLRKSNSNKEKNFDYSKIKKENLQLNNNNSENSVKKSINDNFFHEHFLSNNNNPSNNISFLHEKNNLNISNLTLHNKIEIKNIFEQFYSGKEANEYECNLLLENNFVDPSLIFGIYYSSLRLDIAFQNDFKRFIIIGTPESKINDFMKSIVNNFQYFFLEEESDFKNLLLIVKFSHKKQINRNKIMLEKYNSIINENNYNNYNLNIINKFTKTDMFNKSEEINKEKNENFFIDDFNNEKIEENNGPKNENNNNFKKDNYDSINDMLPRLYSCELKKECGINFTKKNFISEGRQNIANKLREFDNNLNLLVVDSDNDFSNYRHEKNKEIKFEDLDFYKEENLNKPNKINLEEKIKLENYEYLSSEFRIRNLEKITFILEIPLEDLNFESIKNEQSLNLEFIILPVINFINMKKPISVKSHSNEKLIQKSIQINNYKFLKQFLDFDRDLINKYFEKEKIGIKFLINKKLNNKQNWNEDLFFRNNLEKMLHKRNIVINLISTKNLFSGNIIRIFNDFSNIDKIDNDKLIYNYFIFNDEENIFPNEIIKLSENESFKQIFNEERKIMYRDDYTFMNNQKQKINEHSNGLYFNSDFDSKFDTNNNNIYKSLDIDLFKQKKNINNLETEFKQCEQISKFLMNYKYHRKEFLNPEIYGVKNEEKIEPKLKNFSFKYNERSLINENNDLINIQNSYINLNKKLRSFSECTRKKNLKNSNDKKIRPISSKKNKILVNEINTCPYKIKEICQKFLSNYLKKIFSNIFSITDKSYRIFFYSSDNVYIYQELIKIYENVENIIKRKNSINFEENFYINKKINYSISDFHIDNSLNEKINTNIYKLDKYNIEENQNLSENDRNLINIIYETFFYQKYKLDIDEIENEDYNIFKCSLSKYYNQNYERNLNNIKKFLNKKEILTKNNSQKLYLENLDNHTTFEEFQKYKLEYMINKSKFYYENSFKEIEKSISETSNNYSEIEIFHFYSNYERYKTIINDLLCIYANVNYNYNISNKEQMKNTLHLYNVIIKLKKSEYDWEIGGFQEDYLEGLKNFYNEKITQMEAYNNCIKIFTKKKQNQMEENFQILIQEMKIKIDNYLNEVSERNIVLILKIIEELKEKGYLNDFIANYLMNIQNLINLNNFDFEYCYDEIAKDLLIRLGVSSGIAVASGAIGFGISRVLTLITADAVSGSIAGPVGTIAGTAVGLITLVGSSYKYFMDNKNSYFKRYEDLKNKTNLFFELLREKLNEFNFKNNEDISDRLKKLLSYIEFTIRKYIQINNIY